MMSAENVHIAQSAFEQFLQADEWDVPPLLCLFVDDGKAHGLAVVPIHSHHWETGNTVDVLNILAESWEKDGFDRNGLPEEFAISGVGFLHEAWSLNFEDGQEPDESEKEALANGTIHAHPNRVEMKVFSISDFEGNRAVANHARGENSAEFITKFKDAPGSDRDRILDAVARIAAAIGASENAGS